MVRITGYLKANVTTGFLKGQKQPNLCIEKSIIFEDIYEMCHSKYIYIMGLNAYKKGKVSETEIMEFFSHSIAFPYNVSYKKYLYSEVGLLNDDYPIWAGKVFEKNCSKLIVNEE